MLAGSLGTATACRTTPQGDAFLDLIGYTATRTLVEESVKKEMGHSDYGSQEQGAKGIERHDPWAGTAVVNRTINPDGSIVFIVDARRIGKDIDTN